MGKTQLLRRYVLDKFDIHAIGSAGADWKRKRIMMADGSFMEMTIWDTAGSVASVAFYKLCI